MSASGSLDRGPSELYLQLLKGDISSEEYMKRVGKDLAAGRLPGAQPLGASGAAQPEKSKRRS